MDIFLRILKAIDQEVINREVQQSAKVTVDVVVQPFTRV
jgi:hypothetical protein